jgi:hypothetical protein
MNTTGLDVAQPSNFLKPMFPKFMPFSLSDERKSVVKQNYNGLWSESDCIWGPNMAALSQ